MFLHFFVIFGLAVYLYRSFFRFREGNVGKTTENDDWKDCNEDKLPYIPAKNDISEEWLDNKWYYHVENNPGTSEDGKVKFIKGEKVNIEFRNAEQEAITEAKNNYCKNLKNNGKDSAEKLYKEEMDKYYENSPFASEYINNNYSADSPAGRVVGYNVPVPEKKRSNPKKTRRSPKAQNPKRKNTPYKSKSKKYKVGDKVMVEKNRATIINNPYFKTQPNSYYVRYSDGQKDIVDPSIITPVK
jgi:hypothetical protein